MLIHPPEDNPSGLPEMIGPSGYANPATPVQVTLARDEEAAGIESEATKYPPPAYGLWRESVVSTTYIYDIRQNLTLNRGLIQIVFSGNVIKIKVLQRQPKHGRPREIDHHRISLRKVLTM